VLNKPVTSLTCTSQQIARSLKPPSGLHLHPGHLPRSSPLAAKGLSDQLSPIAVSTRLALVDLQQVPSNPQIPARPEHHVCAPFRGNFHNQN